MYGTVGEGDINRIIYSSRWQVERQNAKWAPYASGRRGGPSVHKKPSSGL